jgi:hypothetical protein
MKIKKDYLCNNLIYCGLFALKMTGKILLVNKMQFMLIFMKVM